MNRRRPGLAPLVFSVQIVFLLSATAQGQSDATLSGSVHDQTGAVLAAATIVLTQNGVVTREATTDSAGTFQISDMSPGEYEVLAALRDFGTARRAVRLQRGATVSLSFTSRWGFANR